MSALLDEVRLVLRLPSPARARAIRVEAGLSQPRMAAELGIHRVTLNNWEQGKHRPRGRAGAAYARLLQDLEEAIRA